MMSRSRLSTHLALSASGHAALQGCATGIGWEYGDVFTSSDANETIRQYIISNCVLDVSGSDS